ncbi:hypothetical protein [Bradyrhizobium sp. NP1]|uniref:hypothetical protein n=1 Tax=Bradyrhizobium sp. NP1 TaxID=3049772 RepID=UPI0025A5EB64|nr:hypothetical protein [Bradyrhizobium sp. NP1]WJR77843.1 hypothetical protein QOU61_34915 [Bradyrhizobium sp. NP1]
MPAIDRSVVADVQLFAELTLEEVDEVLRAAERCELRNQNTSLPFGQTVKTIAHSAATDLPVGQSRKDRVQPLREKNSA